MLPGVIMVTDRINVNHHDLDIHINIDITNIIVTITIHIVIITIITTIAVNNRCAELARRQTANLDYVGSSPTRLSKEFIMYYLLKNIFTGMYLCGTGKNWSKTIPPKLYTLGTAKSTQTFYKNFHGVELEIIPVHLEIADQS